MTIKYGKYANIFAEKNVHLQKLLTFFQQKKTKKKKKKKKNGDFDTVLTRTVNILTTNELIKLTTLEQLGPGH